MKDKSVSTHMNQQITLFQVFVVDIGGSISEGRGDKSVGATPFGLLGRGVSACFSGCIDIAGFSDIGGFS